MLIDALICMLFPSSTSPSVQYIVQGHRFNIYEQIGCYPALYNSLPMYLLSAMWLPLLGLVAAVYGILALRAFLCRCTAYTQLLSASPGLPAPHYLHLIVLTLASTLPTLPLGALGVHDIELAVEGKTEGKAGEGEHGLAAYTLEAVTPTMASSHVSEAPYAYALPLHVRWADTAYPALPGAAAHVHGHGADSAEAQ
ncbi:pheromone A receptor-domain-containing protein [Mycena rosella]|uniref:Pheromone A receptor-domain-containing protein n=1 Tax=Mycena rosella TaxID=1033263 RepID=A0AAD7FQV3_MYCRO|nr:pheromone A receptor-domain-containing protein [Mycena rosella]